MSKPCLQSARASRLILDSGLGGTGIHLRNSNIKPWLAEFSGTFVLTLGGFMMATTPQLFPDIGISPLLLIAVLFMTLLALAKPIGRISGYHLTPSFSIGLWTGGRFEGEKVPGYLIAQVLATIAASSVIFALIQGTRLQATNPASFIKLSEQIFLGNAVAIVMIAELLITMFFVISMLSTSRRRPLLWFSNIITTLALTTLQFASMPLVLASIPPVLDDGVMSFARDWANSQFWLFWVPTCVGGALGGMVYKGVSRD